MHAGHPSGSEILGATPEQVWENSKPVVCWVSKRGGSRETPCHGSDAKKTREKGLLRVTEPPGQSWTAGANLQSLGTGHLHWCT